MLLAAHSYATMETMVKWKHSARVLKTAWQVVAKQQVDLTTIYSHDETRLLPLCWLTPEYHHVYKLNLREHGRSRFPTRYLWYP